ncbi:MFS transporter [Streptomyces sp. NBC_00414]|uniref:MFS transporter n=1 Tax=Streptomyces sp. NBC_00414 TaxID=2975739 RepID=UPI002E21D61C
MPIPRPRQREPLGRRFRLLWSSVSVAGLGDGIGLTAVPLLAAQLTSDPREVSLVFLAEQLPWLLVGLLSGVVADRLERRRVLWITDLLRALVAAAFTAAVFTGHASIALLGGVALTLGIGQVMYVGAWAGMVPALVDPANRTRANAALQATAQVTGNLLGSPLSAVLFTVSLAAPFALQTACIAGAAALVALLPGSYRAHKPVQAARTSLWQEVTEGVGWLWNHRLLRLLCVASGGSSLVVVGLTTILVLYTRDVLHLSGVGYALVMVTFAVGGLAGAAVVTRLSERIGVGRTLNLAMIGQTAAVAAAGSASSSTAFCFFVGCYGATTLAWNVMAVSVRQSLVPDRLIGRVNMTYQLINAGASALGAAASGIIAHLLGLRAPFGVGAVVLLAISIMAARRLHHHQYVVDGSPSMSTRWSRWSR